MCEQGLTLSGTTRAQPHESCCQLQIYISNSFEYERLTFNLVKTTVTNLGQGAILLPAPQ